MENLSHSSRRSTLYSHEIIECEAWNFSLRPSLARAAHGSASVRSGLQVQPAPVVRRRCASHWPR